MSLLRRGLLLTSLSIPGLLLAGCPFLEDFPRVGRDDDDTVADDDDDDDDGTGDEAPVIVIEGLDPLVTPVTGRVTVQYSVTDPDSDAYTVFMTFGTEAGSLDQVPVLTNATGASNEFSETVAGAPPLSVGGGLEWDTVSAFPTTAEGIIIQLCVSDNDGNVGNCDTYPDEGTLAFQNTLESGLGAFCQPGHLEEMSWLGGRSIVPLSDGECLNYQSTDPPLESDFAAQFLLVLVNPGSGEAGFTITATDQPTILAAPEPSSARLRRAPARQRGEGSYSADAVSFGDTLLAAAGQFDAGAPRFDEPDRERFRRDALETPFNPTPDSACTPDLTEDDLHNDARTFFFRSTIEEDSTRETRGANLRALGDHVAIYVDNETPIDFDEDCSDPSNPVEASDLPSFGFTNCDLEEVVATFDTNIYPTVTGLYGEPSDVDSDCRVTVFLSHRLNRLTLTNEDPIDDGFVVKSFAEPDTDLWQSNLSANPNSNEQEVLFLYSPDPVGFWSEQTVQLDDYLTYEVGGQLAFSLQKLISYGHHRNVGKTLLDKTNPEDVGRPPAEEDWLDDALGLLAADLTGFGAIAFQDAWIYMDAPHLLALQVANTLESFEDRGGQYLFARYLHDRYGDSMISAIIDAEDTTGEASVAAVVGSSILEEGGGGGDDDDSAGGGGGEGDPTEIFNEFAVQWAIAMAISGQVNEAGNPLVPDATNFNYRTSSQVSVTDPEVPVVGELYGANGFQQGFNVRGINRTFEDGRHPDGAAEIDSLRVKTENLDPQVFHPQSDFFGFVQADFGVAVVLVSGLEQPENYLLIETATGEPLIGKVIRVNDDNPHVPSLTLEDVDGAKITTVRNLGILDVDGTERRVIGRVDDAENMSVSITPDAPGDDDDSGAPIGARADDDDSAAAPEDLLIADTDRFRFEIESTQLVGIWADRRYAAIDGVVELDDPFLAVMPTSDLPNAFDYGMWNWGPNSGPCPDPSLFSYPVIMPLWLAAQANLLAEPTATPNSEFEALTGAPGVTLPCSVDHDQDGLPDAEEPSPETLAEQIILRQAENLAIDPAFYEGGFDLISPDPVATGSQFDQELPLIVTQPFFSDLFIDLDSNESPSNDFPTNVQLHNIGGRMYGEGEEAVWFGTLPAGEYIVVVGGASESVGAYDLSLRVLVPSPSLP